MSNKNDQLDTSIEIVTPENVSFRYHVAGPFRRLPAYLIDFGLQFLTLMVVGTAISIACRSLGLPSLGSGLTMILWFVVSWFYGGLFETYWNGQTPGKRMMRIRVIATDGQPINGLQAVLRNFLRGIDSQPIYPLHVNIPGIEYIPIFLHQFGLFSALMNNRFQRLGDLAAGTMVIVEDREWFQGIIKIDEPDVVRLAQQIPPSFQASPSLGRALAAYVQRRLAFPAMRRIEVARHLAEPLAKRFGLPEGINPDHLLCAAYQRAFITDTPSDLPEPVSPFVKTASLVSTTPDAEAIPVGEVLDSGESPFGPLPAPERSEA